MPFHSVVVLAAESGAHEESEVSPWLIGGVILAVLVLLLIILVAFAGGREHS